MASNTTLLPMESNGNQLVSVQRTDGKVKWTVVLETDENALQEKVEFYMFVGADSMPTTEFFITKTGVELLRRHLDRIPE